MARTKIFLIILLVLLALTLIAWHLSQPILGPHGGTIKQTGNYYIQVKTSYPYLYAFLLDKEIKPISNKGISCEARFIFADHTDMKVALTTFEEDGFSTRLTTQEFISSQIYFNGNGISVTAQFENQKLIAKTEN